MHSIHLSGTAVATVQNMEEDIPILAQSRAAFPHKLQVLIKGMKRNQNQKCESHIIRIIAT